MSQIVSKKLRIDGMHCTACAMDIDGALEDINGVKESRTNYARAETEVNFDTEKVSEERVRKIITELGYAIIE